MTGIFNRGHRGRNGRRLVSAVAALAASGAVPGLVTATPAAASPTAAPPAVGTTFTYSAWPHLGQPLCTVGVGWTIYVVPADVTSVQIVAIGAPGQGGGYNGGGGGEGDQVQAVVSVNPGEYLYVLPAGDNGTGGPGYSGTTSSGGNGGEASYVTLDPASQNPASYTNGGRQLCASDQAKAVVVAGGGGGGGGGAALHSGGNGGDAGLPKGVNGGAGGHNGKFAGAGGSGGSQTGAGKGGNGGNGGDSAGSAGTYGLGEQGGCGGPCTMQQAGSQDYDGGGGGGGGYYGAGGGGDGNGGGGGGGGGGSSFVTPGATFVSVSTTTASPSISITPVAGAPGAPTGVSAAAGLDQATVSFTPSTVDGGAPVTSYTVTEEPDGLQTQGTGTPITVTNLTPGTPHTFTVTATNAYGQSVPSASTSPVISYRVPGRAVITQATAGNGQVTVTAAPAAVDASAKSGVYNPITQYTVTARAGINVTSGPGLTATGTVTPQIVNGVTTYDSPPITVTGLTNGTNYTVTVYATNAAGNGSESKPAVVFPATVPGAPTNVTAANATPVGATTGTVDLTFSPPAGNGGVSPISYTAVSSPGGITATAGAGSPDLAVTGLAIGTPYTFTVYATNDFGNGPASDMSNQVTPTPVGLPSPPQVPGAATLDQAAYVSCRAPASDGGSAITSYTVTASPGGITATGPYCPILVSGLTDGTTYTFTVTATNADGGTSEPSQASGPVTPHPPSAKKPPSNDAFANAQVIKGTSGSVVGTNVGASVEPGEPTIQDSRGGASVWYKWTVPASATYQFDTCSANPAVVGLIGTFIGNSAANVTEYGSGPSQSSCPVGEAGATLIVSAGAGETLYFKFDGLNAGGNANPPYEGPFTLEWMLST